MAFVVVEGQGHSLIRFDRHSGTIDRFPVIAFKVDLEADGHKVPPEALIATGEGSRRHGEDVFVATMTPCGKVIDGDGSDYESEAAWLSACEHLEARLKARTK